MANPELQVKLQELDHELAEGDITQKGYEKRRTAILSTYLGPEEADRILRHSRIPFIESNNGFGNTHTQGGGRSASLAALTAGDQSMRSMSMRSSQYDYPNPQGMAPPSQVGRFQEREMGLGVHRSVNRQPSFQERPRTPTGQGQQYQYDSRSGTMMGSDFRFNPAQQGNQYDYKDDGDGSFGSPNNNQSRLSTMLDSGQQGYFSDFAGTQDGSSELARESYGGGNSRYSVEPFSPSAAIPPPAMELPGNMVQSMSPLEPRDVPFDAFDPHNPNIPMSKFDNIAAVLQHRGKANGRTPAYWVLDSKGKEMSSITFEKLHSRAERVAQVIKDKSNLYRGDRVALVYREAEVIDFAVALLGCFLAGVVAVPMNNVDDYAKLSLLLTTTQAHLALTTDNNLKAFQRDISAQRLKWPTGVEWWKTNEFGSYHPSKRKGDGTQLPAPDLAYIEFSRAPTGDLRGVVLSHRTIMHQMACLQAVVSTVPTKSSGKDTMHPGLRNSNGSFVAGLGKSGGETILSYLDPREGCGMILGVLLGVYGGHTTIWFESRTVDTPGLYAHLISKYRATMLVADYPGLKRAVYNYQQDPMATRNFKKGVEPNFGALKLCCIETLTVDCEFHEILADRWLRPMRNQRARELVAPMLCLPEHGGMVVSMRDWLGGEERMGCVLGSLEQEDEEAAENAHSKENGANGSGSGSGYTSLIGGSSVPKADKRKARTGLTEVLLDKEALKTNEVVVLAIGAEVERRASEPGTLRVGAFGYPIPDATLAVVDPETSLLCPEYSVGEIWVDSPSLSGGFWALPKHTETIFHARPFRFVDGSPTPVLIEPEFLRTGLLGCVIEGKVFVLGLYEDRIRQRVEYGGLGVGGEVDLEHRYFFVQHLVTSIMKNVLKIYDCSAFDSHVNGEYLPIILIETQAASTAPTNPGGPPRQLDIPFLDSLAERVMDVLYAEHSLRVYCVMITLPNALPRIVKNGRREIGNMLCRKEFDAGSLACVHVKFGIERAVQNLPWGADPEGGVWSQLASQSREAILYGQEKQYSGVDYREVVIDERTSTPLTQFSNIQDLLQWRVARQAEELAICTIDSRGKEGKAVPWKKFDQKVAAVAMYMRNKLKIQAGHHVVLMYTHSEEFVYAVHACFVLGAVAIAMAPLDQNRLNEDAPALLHVIADFGVKAILVNGDVDTVLKAKPVQQHLKQSAVVLKVNVPGHYNTSKPPKQSSGCRDLGLTIRKDWVAPGRAALVWVFWTPDQRRIAVQLGHDTIMALCKVQKETCQMTSSRPVLGCVRSTMGLGFIHTVLMGIYLAAPTYLVSPVDFAQNPHLLFQTLARYKVKDTYATTQMMDHAMSLVAGKAAGLHELKNLMILGEGRAKVDVFQKVRLHFAAAGLDRTAINTVYSHVLNPMVASRSYMCIEPIELWLDRNALRRGLVAPVHPDADPTALLVQDSGMVPVSTQICIVNPETNCLCHVGEYGEVWVQSEANVQGFYGSKDIFDKERFQGRTVDGDPNVRYMRTGDLGFLHTVSRPIGPNGSPVEMQVLFLLGSIGETFEVNGLLHFPMDIEESVERCHRNIVPSGCAVFQAGGLVVVLVEIFRKNFLASIVPVIVNSILNHHNVVVDIVAFVGKGDFPRSRLGEKQRGKILAGWVTRKILTIAQFCIREEDDGRVGGIAEEGQMPGKQSVGSRSSAAGLRPASTAMSMTSSMMGGTTRVASHASAGTMGGPNTYQPDRSSSNLLSPAQGGPDYYQPSRPEEELQRPSSSNHVELPAPLDIPELPSGTFSEHEVTPTNSGGPRHMSTASGMSGGTVGHEIDEMLRHPQLALVTSQTTTSSGGPTSYSPIDPRNNPFANSPASQGRGSMERSPVDYEGLAYNEARGSFDDMPPAPQSAAAIAAARLAYDESPGYSMSKKPYMQLVNHNEPQSAVSPYTTTATSQPNLDDDWYAPPPGISADPVPRTGSPSNRNMLPSQMRRQSQALLSSSRNQSQTDLSARPQKPPPLPAKISPETEDGDDEWRRNALGYLGYAGVGGTGGHYGK